MGAKLSHRLLDLGFFCALGTSEYPGRGDKVEPHVKYGTPFTFDTNQGVMVVYDEAGRPWIMLKFKFTDTIAEEVVSSAVQEFGMKCGAHVPHSNDGLYFMLQVLPRLDPNFGKTEPEEDAVPEEVIEQLSQEQFDDRVAAVTETTEEPLQTCDCHGVVDCPSKPPQ